MTIAGSTSKAAVAIGVAAMTLVTLCAPASAYEGRRGGHREWRERGYAERHYAPPPRHYRSYDDHDRRQRDRDKRVARGVAIGVGALILGTILAAEANRRHGDYDGH